MSDMVPNTFQPSSKAISKKEYLSMLSLLGQEMQSLWEQEDKVGSLQKSVSCIKSLWLHTNDLPFLSSRYQCVLPITTQFACRVYWRVTKLQQTQLKSRGTSDQKSK